MSHPLGTAAATSSGPNGGTVADDGLKIWSCVTCRRRKIRCDRKDPCQHCVKAGIECHFPVTGRLPRRSRDPHGLTKTPLEKESELLTRIRRLESLVTELAGQLEDGNQQHQDQPQQQLRGSIADASASIVTPSDSYRSSSSSGPHGGVTSLSLASGNEAVISQIDEELNEDFGKLLVGQDGSLHIGQEFWSIFCNEVSLYPVSVHLARVLTPFQGATHLRRCPGGQ